MNNFFEVLEELREKKQISKQNLAINAGLTPSYVSHLTLGSRGNPSEDTVIKLATALALDNEEKQRLFEAAGLQLPSPPNTGSPLPAIPITAIRRPGEADNEDWGDIPSVQTLFGREDELEKLRNWIVHEHCQMVIVSGSGGVGKTMLTTTLALDIAKQFDYVFWRSLKNVPPFENLLDQCLLLLSNQQPPDPRLSLDERIHKLLDYLKEQRCLLILDDMEAILQEKEYTGEYREGYEGYGRLFEVTGGTKHKSCLLLTTRELPKETALLAGETSPVRVFDLKGLKVKDGFKILAEKNLSWDKQREDAEKLVLLYAGNPLALKVAAEFIRDAFAGNIAMFLANSTSIFHDIQDVLEQQFGRLSPLEQQIMYWLAIEREAISISDLSNEFAAPPPIIELADALQSLKRRSLVEIQQMAYILQPVVLEFITQKLIARIVKEIGHKAIELLDSHTLLKARAKVYIRNAQMNLILDPIAKRLLTHYGKEGREERLKAVLHKLHETSHSQPGYAAGNLLNLLIYCGYDLSGYDFSHLFVWQAYLQGISLNNVDFSYANLARSVFTDTFTSILSVSLSPDNRLFAAGTENGDVRLWDADSGTPFRTYQGHTGRVRSVIFSPDGQKIISGSEDHTVRVWSVNSDQCLHLLHGHIDRVRAVAVSPDGSSIISASDDCSVRIWDMQTGNTLKVLPGHTSRVRAVAVSPDGAIIASGGEDHNIFLWDARSGTCLKTLKGHEKSVHVVNFSLDGKLLVSGSEDHTIRLWNIPSGECLRMLKGHTNQVRCVAFNLSGDKLVSGADDTTIRLWDIESGECLKVLEGHLHRVYCVAFNREGTTIISGSEDQTVRVWDTQTGQSLKTLQGYINQVRSVAFNPAGTLLVSGGDDHQLRLWNVQSGQLFRTLTGHTNGIRSVSFNPDGTRIASGSDDRTVQIWNTQTGKCVRVLPEHMDRVRTIAFNHDGTRLASGGEDQMVRIWDVPNGQRLKLLQGHTDWVRSVAFSPDDALLASGSEDYNIRIWDAKSGECLSILRDHTNGVRSVAFSPDGHILASSGDDTTIRLWNTATWQTFMTLQAQEEPSWVLSVAFSPDGTLLASGSEDAKARIWDVKMGQRVSIMEGHEHRIYSVAFHPDGRTLASGSLDGTIRLWDVATGECTSILRINKPYEGMKIVGVEGLTETQEAILKELGAVGEE